MSGTWGNDPVVQPAPAVAPQATGWGNDPVVGSQTFRFSDEAIRNAAMRPSGKVVMMSPQQYLALAPDLPKSPKTDKKGKALNASLAAGENVNEVPSLEVVTDKSGHARVTDQDGRHRAQAAIDAGVGEIPVVVQAFGDSKPIKSLTGMRDGASPIPFDFKPYPVPVSRETSPKPSKPQAATTPAAVDWLKIAGDVLSPPTAAARSITGSAPVRALTGEKPDTSLSGRFEQGLSDPINGALQLGAHMVQDQLSPLGPNALSEMVRRNATDPLDKSIKAQDAATDASRGPNAGLDYARLAGNVTSPVNMAAGVEGEAPTAARLTAPLLTRIVRDIPRNAAGGAVIAALNPVTGGDFWSDKTKQTAYGLVGGAVVPPIFKAGANLAIRSGSAVLAPITRLFAATHGPNATVNVAEQEIMRRLGQGIDGGGPTAQDMIDLFRRTPDKPLTLMDVGSQPVNALAGRVARRPGAPGQIIGDFLGDRTDAQGQRLEGDVGKNVQRGSAYSTIDALQHSRANAAAPLYDKAYAANQAVASPTIDRILETPAGKSALAAARTKMQNDMSRMGVPDKEIAEQLRELGEPVPKGGVASGLNLRSLDYVKRSFGDMIGTAQRAGENDNVRILTGLKKSFVKALDDADVTGRAGPNSLKPEGGLYKQAREAYSGPSQSIEAVDFGRNALKPSTSVEEVAATFRGLNKNDREFARMGLASALREFIGKVNVGSNAAIRLARNPAIQSRIRPFFESDTAYQKFMDSVAVEDRMHATVTDVLGGSPTARRVAEDTDHGNAALESSFDGAVDLKRGNYLRGLRKLMESMNHLSRSADPEVAANIARILSTPLNEADSPGMRLLRNFAAVMPGTRNYLAQATNRAARATVVPTGVIAGNNP